MSGRVLVVLPPCIWCLSCILGVVGQHARDVHLWDLQYSFAPSLSSSDILSANVRVWYRFDSCCRRRYRRRNCIWAERGSGGDVSDEVQSAATCVSYIRLNIVGVSYRHSVGGLYPICWAVQGIRCHHSARRMRTARWPYRSENSSVKMKY